MRKIGGLKLSLARKKSPIFTSTIYFQWITWFRRSFTSRSIKSFLMNDLSISKITFLSIRWTESQRPLRSTESALMFTNLLQCKTTLLTKSTTLSTAAISLTFSSIGLFTKNKWSLMLYSSSIKLGTKSLYRLLLSQKFTEKLIKKPTCLLARQPISLLN